MLPNRQVTYLTAALGLVAALAPVIADLDWESTTAVIAGAGIVASAALTWLRGWQKYEERTALADLDETDPFSGPDPDEGADDSPLEPGPEGTVSKPTIRRRLPGPPDPPMPPGDRPVA